MLPERPRVERIRPARVLFWRPRARAKATGNDWAVGRSGGGTALRGGSPRAGRALSFPRPVVGPCLLARNSSDLCSRHRPGPRTALDLRSRLGPASRQIEPDGEQDRAEEDADEPEGERAPQHAKQHQGKRQAASTADEQRLHDVVDSADYENAPHGHEDRPAGLILVN